MIHGSPARLALAVLGIGILAGTAAAQPGSGDGFLFRPPPGTFTVYGGLAAPMASGGVFSLATRELTLDRGDFQSGSFGVELAFAANPRTEVVLGLDRSASRSRSEYRDWVDNNDLPIEQTTSIARTPIMLSARYFLSDRGRRVGSVAWIPARFVPFVSAGAGAVAYRFEQVGDFVDEQTTNIFFDRLKSSGWAPALQGGAGAQWSLTPRLVMTGELRYLHATGDGDRPRGDFAGYKVNLSGVSTLMGLTLRF